MLHIIEFTIDSYLWNEIVAGQTADLFTSVLYDLYVAPSKYCFDILCDDDPIIDDRDSPEFNADQKVCLCLVSPNTVMLTSSVVFFIDKRSIFK